MRKIKRLISVMLSVVMVLMLTACGKSITIQKDKETTKSDTVATTESALNEEEKSEDVAETYVKPEKTGEGDIRLEDDGQLYSQTIIIYMVGSNLESKSGAATQDLEEIANSGVNTDNCNVVVFCGGSNQWDNGLVEEGKDAILVLNQDGSFDAKPISTKNMGDVNTLSSFIDACYSSFESDKYGLILWNHGSGPIGGYGYDEKNTDVLTLAELENVMKSTIGDKGRHLEFVGFDACLMNSVETLEVFAPYADYFIASQETEPGWGWDYSFLADTDHTGMNGARMGRSIIDAYIEFNQNKFEDEPESVCDVTLSCIDLREYNQFSVHLDNIFAEMTDKLTLDTYGDAVRTRVKMKSFGNFSTNFDYCMVDLRQLIHSAGVDKEVSENALQAFDKMVVYEKSNIDNSGGVSICYPYNCFEDYAEYCKDTWESIGFSRSYTEYMGQLESINNGKTIATDWDISDNVAVLSEKKDNYDIALQLTEEQKKNFALAGYYILVQVDDKNSKNEKGESPYLFTYAGRISDIEEDGTIRGKYGKNALYLRENADGELSPTPWLLIENADSTKECQKYTFLCTLHKYGADMVDWQMDIGYVQMQIDDKHPDGQILSVVPLEDSKLDVPYASKQLLKIEDYNLMSTQSYERYVTYGQDGKILGFADWDTGENIRGIEVDVKEGFSFERHELDDNNKYVCQFFVTDTQGNTTYSELIPLN